MHDSAPTSGSRGRLSRLVLILSLLLAALLVWLWRPVDEVVVIPDPPLPASDLAGGVAVDIGDRRGSLVDQVVFTQEADLGKVAELIESGSHQLFGQGVSNATVFRRIRDSLAINYSSAFGSSAELTINPAGPRFLDGRINPFHVPAIREALNWLVDRRYVAEELYGGLAVPRVLPINTVFPDYARLAEVARTLELRYQHDPARARAVIAREMTALGATLVDGVWMHEGAPVKISILIRTDDERRRVGDYLGNLLEEQGFAVERLYRAADEASRIWIAGDPAAGRWHVYTGGWVSTMISRDLADNLAYYYTALGRPEPLWQIYQPDPELQILAERLQRADYVTWAERQQMMARGIELAMADSVRVWLVDVVNVLPRAANVELTTDLAGGVGGSALWAYTLRYTDRVGGSVVVGLPTLLAEPWNAVAGSNWIFDRIIMRGLSDSVLLPDPFTGLFWPQRIESATVTVEADVPVVSTHDWLTVTREPEIVVPDDAWIDWNAATESWISVAEKHPEGLRARAAVQIRYEDDYLEHRWHDGTRVSLADLLIPLILNFERANPDSRLYDPAHEMVFQIYQQHFKGMRIISEAPLIIEIYGDQVYPDAEVMVATRAPGISAWHTLALGILAERQGELAFSSNKADQEQVDWMSLVAGPSLVILARHLREATAAGYVPFAGAMAGYLREGEAAERYRGLTDWYAQRRHLWVDNGPLYLHSVHPVERSVVLRRFEAFPDRADKWLRFDRPRIPALDLDGPMIVRQGEAPVFELGITFDDQAYPRDDIELARFMLFDGRGQLRFEGDAEPAGPGQWTVAFSAEQIASLGVGANTLELAITSVHVSLPAFATHAFATVSR